MEGFDARNEWNNGWKDGAKLARGESTDRRVVTDVGTGEEKESEGEQRHKKGHSEDRNSNSTIREESKKGKTQHRSEKRGQVTASNTERDIED